MADIFLSYAREDRETAKALAQVLADHGWLVWWDRQIPSGRRFYDVIERELTAARCVIALWSDAALRSLWVREEAQEGLERDILVPVRIEAIRPPIGFRSIQMADLIGWGGDQAHPGFAQLMADITAVLGEAPAKERGAEPEAKPKRPAKPRANKPMEPRDRPAGPGQPVTRPPWASDSGQDRYGSWVEIRVPPLTGTPVVQRLRWIEPGTFRMGSPKGEAGRYDREGPQHEVRISQGFWLFDTPCTQALWEAVMGENLSRFRSPDRPVEWVNWNDIQEFLKRIEEHIPGLGLGLPTEAQWEYACRAGTDTATYAGDLKIVDERNAPGLDAIAWYGGNSGVGFELDNGEDSSDWPGKQYPHDRAGTHPVGQKEPNAWGLSDMLGNVWEWCADGLRDYGPESVVDPVGPIKARAFRVIRSGAWSCSAREVRSACRRADDPGMRDDYLGFRCARVPS